LTESGVHRLEAGVGTQVSLHTYRGDPITVTLLGIRDVATWTDLTERVTRGQPIHVESPVRMVFAGGVVIWAECESDREQVGH
jgi:hypothetical protein